MPFENRMLEIPELIIIEPKIFKDERGHFYESYKKSDFSEFGINEYFIQDSYSVSKKNVLRALHYQIPPKVQGKLVRVIYGKIFA